MDMKLSDITTDADFDRRWMGNLLERLAPAEVSVHHRLSIHTFPHRQWPRECFARACQYIEMHRIKGLRYVLGAAACGGLQQHGWVEIGNIVFDGVLQRFYDKDKYYESEHARLWYKFTRSAVLWILEQSFSSWRWDVHLRLPWAKSAQDRTAPVLHIDKKDAQKFLATARLKKGRS